jgi:hypothetical protein
MLAAWHARFVLMKVTGALDLVEWAGHPYRTLREILIALDKAIHLQRGTKRVHRGGWRISTAPFPRTTNADHPGGPHT